MNVNYNAATLNPLDTSERYTYRMGILYLFNKLGMANPIRTRLLNDGLSSMNNLVEQYGYDTTVWI